MMYFRLLLIITVLSFVSWLVLKIIAKPRSFVLVLLAWIFIFIAGFTVFYGLSFFVAGINNS